MDRGRSERQRDVVGYSRKGEGKGPLSRMRVEAL